MHLLHGFLKEWSMEQPYRGHLQGGLLKVWILDPASGVRGGSSAQGNLVTAELTPWQRRTSLE